MARHDGQFHRAHPCLFALSANVLPQTAHLESWRTAFACPPVSIGIPEAGFALTALWYSSVDKIAG